MCAIHQDLAGTSLGHVQATWADRFAPELRAAGVGPSQLDGVRRVLDRLSTSRVAAPCDPRALREVVFPLATHLPHDEAVAQAASTLGIDSSEVESALFADRRAEQLLVGPATMPEIAELRERYNLDLVQRWLTKCSELRIIIREGLRPVVRYAKLLGLLVGFSQIEDAVQVQVSGPLALFRRTVKYGRALARFFPCVVASPGYSAVADCVQNGEVRRIEVRAGDPVRAPHSLPRDTDSKIERALVRDLRRLDTPWRLVREDRVVRLDGGRMFFPDFSLVKGEHRVLVEVVGFYTADYLRRKTEALRATKEPCIVCVDGALDCGGEEFAGRVMRFDKRVDAPALIARAEQMSAPPAPSGTLPW